MPKIKKFIRLKQGGPGLSLAFLGLFCAASVTAQTPGRVSDAEFGPVMRAYLGYLRNEQEVVDDRASRHEINMAYYRRNSNRIHALRQMAIRLVRETGNDYVPELEAVTQAELRNIFAKPPSTAGLHVGGVINNTFRFLGAERVGEVFYLFARLNPYEQTELMQKTINEHRGVSASEVESPHSHGAATRPRRASSP